jgi:hypothetical protein
MNGAFILWHLGHSHPVHLFTSFGVGEGLSITSFGVGGLSLNVGEEE